MKLFALCMAPAHKWGAPSHIWGTPAHTWGTPAHTWGTPAHTWGAPAHTWGTPAHVQYEGHLHTHEGHLHTYSMRDTCTHTVWGTPAHTWGTLCGEAIDLCTLCFGVREDCINCTEALHTVCRWAGNLIVEWLADSPCSTSPDGSKTSAYSFTLTHYQWWGVLCLSTVITLRYSRWWLQMITDICSGADCGVNWHLRAVQWSCSCRLHCWWHLRQQVKNWRLQLWNVQYIHYMVWSIYCITTCTNLCVCICINFMFLSLYVRLSSWMWHNLINAKELDI